MRVRIGQLIMSTLALKGGSVEAVLGSGPYVWLMWVTSAPKGTHIPRWARVRVGGGVSWQALIT